jgi:hypothetical protein
MHNIIVFGDRHQVPEPTLTITKLLPLLARQGYNTLCIEDFFPDNEPIQSVVQRKQEILKSVELFPNGKIPPYCNREQFSFLQYMDTQYEQARIANIIKSWYRVKMCHEFSLNEHVALFEEAKKLNIKIVSIDYNLEENPSYRNLLVERTRYMFERISAVLQKPETNNVIVFCGLSHVINCWDCYEDNSHHYERGLLNLFESAKDLNIGRCLSYYVIPKSYNDYYQLVGYDGSIYQNEDQLLLKKAGLTTQARIKFLSVRNGDVTLATNQILFDLNTMRIDNFGMRTPFGKGDAKFFSLIFPPNNFHSFRSYILDIGGIILAAKEKNRLEIVVPMEIAQYVTEIILLIGGKIFHTEPYEHWNMFGRYCSQLEID